VSQVEEKESRGGCGGQWTEIFQRL